MAENSQQLASFMLPGAGYGYTGVNVEDVMATELTLATGLLDESGSTTKFKDEMEKCVQTVVRSMRHSPRADNLMYRHCHFATNFREIHGYKLLQDINESDYKGCYHSNGTTSLYDSMCNVFRALKDYGQQMMQSKRMANGIIYVFTDGMDLGSTHTEHDSRDDLAALIASEALESVNTILIGVNDEKSVQDGLKAMAKNIGFTQYIAMKDASESQLAKLADFISHSISSQSQALGSNGPSQTIDPSSVGLDTDDSITF